MTSRTRHALPVGAVLLLATALRLFRLGANSLWMDEIYRVSLATQPLGALPGLIVDHMAAPLRYVVAHFSLMLARSEFVLRLPDALAGVLTVAVTYRLARILFGRSTGAISALLLSASSYHLAHSQDANPPAAWTLLVTLSMFFFYEGLQTRRWQAWAIYALVTALALYTHYYSGMYMLVQGAYALAIAVRTLQEKAQNGEPAQPAARIRSVAVRLGGAWAGVSLAFAPWLPVMAEQAVIARPDAGIFPIGWSEALWTVARAMASYSRGYLLISLLLLVAGFALSWRHARRPYLLMGLWLTLPATAILSFFVATGYRTVLSARYFLPTLVPFVCLVAQGVVKVGTWAEQAVRIRWRLPVRTSAYVSALSAMLLVPSLRSVRSYFVSPQHENWREAARFVDAAYRPGDLALFSVGFTQDSFDWYSRAPKESLVRFQIPPSHRPVDGHDLENLRALLGSHDRVWAIFSNDLSGNAEAIRSVLAESRRVVLEREFTWIRVLLFDRS